MNTEYLKLCGKFAVMAVFIMAIIYIVAILTPKIAEWIDNQKIKNKKIREENEKIQAPVTDMEEERKRVTEKDCKE